MADNVSDFIVERLSEWGVKRIFGYPGDGINGFFNALNKANGRIELVQVRHEEMAAFMACAHAKYTGDVGICVATSGPGAIHLLNGLYDAKMDHQPVVAIVGQQQRAALGGSYQQEVDLISLFKDVAGPYVHMATVPSQARHLIDRAIRIARAERTVTCVILPNDVQELEAVEKPPRSHGAIHSSKDYRTPRIIPKQEDLQKAADILNEGEKVAMLIGAGALRAKEAVKEVAELTGAGVAKALLGKATLDDTLPYVTGSIGLLGTKPSWNMMTACDTLLMVGTSFPYSEFLPEEGQARGIQIDIDAKMIGIRYPTEMNLVGDSKETLEALIPLLKRKEDRSWRATIEKDVKEWWEVLEERAMEEADPINPQRVFWELSKKLPADVILSSDSGSSANWFARDLKVKETMMASLSGNLATMTPGVPYAIAAKFAYPERPAIAMVGDGAMQMMGNNGLITISKYWKQWKNPQLIVLVLNNQDLNQVTWEQRVMTGEPKYEGSQNIPNFPYAGYASSLGLKGIKVDRPENIEQSISEALMADRPVVLEVMTDPNVPPLPPHITFEQAVSFAKSMLKGDVDTKGIFKQSVKATVDSFIH